MCSLLQRPVEVIDIVLQAGRKAEMHTVSKAAVAAGIAVTLGMKS
jgi:hypothetical protein